MRDDIGPTLVGERPKGLPNGGSIVEEGENCGGDVARLEAGERQTFEEGLLDEDSCFPVGSRDG